MAKTTVQRSLTVDEEMNTIIQKHLEENGMTFAGLIRVLLRKYAKEKGLM